MKNHEPTEDFLHTNSTNLKRKWYYGEENALNTAQMTKTIRKSVTMCYDYENYNPNHQIASPSVVTTSAASVDLTTTTTTISYNDVNMSPKIVDHSSDIELSESVEYVNILYDNNLLSSVDSPMVTEPNYINFETNWSNADILDLDQRNFYYETATVTADHHNQHHHQQPQQQQAHMQHHTTNHSMYPQSQQLSNDQLNGDVHHVDMQEHLNISTASNANDSSREYILL